MIYNFAFYKSKIFLYKKILRNNLSLKFTLIKVLVLTTKNYSICIRMLKVYFKIFFNLYFHTSFYISQQNNLY